jgi:hypothetical protein
MAAVAAVVSLAASVLQAAEPSPQVQSGSATNTVSVSIPQSVFFVDLEKGRDPFYPKAPRGGGGNTTPVPKPVSLDDLVERFIVLRGITGQEGNRVALINNQTFKVGDASEVRLGSADQKMKVTLLRILDRAVVFKVEGSDREFEKALSE